MTVFDVVAFNMLVAIEGGAATAVTASDWASVISAMTAQISVCRYSFFRSFRSGHCRFYYADLSGVRDRGAGD